MSDFAISYVEYRCPNCGQVLWSKDPEEIEIWRELNELGVFECPACHSKMEMVGQKVILGEMVK
ncbi:MAG: hypothetical protein J7J34_05745 [Thermoplasmata archaeon]|nr:hypothetical protein [Thermoplasmata archaeon]